MNEKILKFDTYRGALCEAAVILKRRQVELTVKHILLVPEKDTLKCERLLFCGGGAFDIEVYSLTRWFYKLGGGRLLSRTGAVMILKDILRFLDLKCFYRSKNFSGFCSKLYDTICRFWDYSADLSGGLSGGNTEESALNPQKSFDLPGALGLKLEDFKLIAAEFEKRAAGYYIGRSGTTRLIAERLKTDNFLHNAHVYAVNFDRLNAAEQELFCLIGEKALSFTRFETSGRPPVTAETEVYRAPDIIGCLKAAALRIREKNRSGEAFNDMAVIAPDLNFEQAKRILEENGIPFYADKSERLSQTRLAGYINCLISLKRLTRREFIRLAKNPFSGVEPDAADVFENYVNAFSIDYLGFSSPFTLTNPLRDIKNEAERLKTAEKVRRLLFKAVSEFWEGVSKAKTAAEFCVFLRRTLDVASGETPEKQKIHTLLNEIEEFLGGKKTDGNILTEALKEGMTALELSKLPLTQDCVLIGDAGIFKGNGIKHVFAVGFNEGVIPAPANPDGLLTENEIRSLNSAGIALPLKEDLNKQKDYELLQLFSDAETLFISYVDDGESRPSPLLYTVKAEVKNIAYSDYESEKRRAEAGDAAAAIRLAGSKSAALETLILNKESRTLLTCSLSGALYEDAQKYLRPAAPPAKINQKLFFKNKTVSVSQLQSYFLCPYKHFIDYGLRAAARDKGEMDFLDIGGAAHKAGELYVRFGLDDSRLPQIAEDVLNSGVYAYKLGGRQKERLKKEIVSLCQKFGGNIKRGQFKPLGAEIRFGKGEKEGELKGIDIGGVTLKGSVDYADTKDGYIRIVDYKTGSAEITEKEVYYGRKLQLPLYMRVMAENGYTPAAMLYFLFKDTRKEDNRFCGVYLKDKQVLLDFDTQMEDENAVVSAKIRQLKSGAEKITGSGAVTHEDFKAYLDYASSAARVAAKQIEEGNIAPSPLKDGGFFICDYCDFVPACGGGAARLAGKARIKSKNSAGLEETAGEDAL